MWDALPFMQKLPWIQPWLHLPCFDLFSWFSHWDRRFHFARIGFYIVILLPWNLVRIRLWCDASTALIIEFHWNHRDFASDRTEAVWQVLYVSPTSFTSTSKLQFCRWFRVFRLWPGTQMNSLLPIYLISLNIATIKMVLQVGNTNDVLINILADL